MCKIWRTWLLTVLERKKHWNWPGCARQFVFPEPQSLSEWSGQGPATATTAGPFWFSGFCLSGPVAFALSNVLHACRCWLVTGGIVQRILQDLDQKVLQHRPWPMNTGDWWRMCQICNFLNHMNISAKQKYTPMVKSCQAESITYIKSILYCKYARQSARWLKRIRSVWIGQHTGIPRRWAAASRLLHVIQDKTLAYSLSCFGMHWLDRCTTCSCPKKPPSLPYLQQFPYHWRLRSSRWQQQLGRLKDRKLCLFHAFLYHHASISCSSCLPWADSQKVFLINLCEACHEYQKPDIFTRNLSTYTLG